MGTSAVGGELTSGGPPGTAVHAKMSYGLGKSATRLDDAKFAPADRMPSSLTLAR